MWNRWEGRRVGEERKGGMKSSRGTGGERVDGKKMIQMMILIPVLLKI